MIVKQTTRYTLPIKTKEQYAEAAKFADGISAFYGWGGAEVRVNHDMENHLLIVEYDHLIETKDTVFGGN